jgi:hypothetical protein
MKGEIKMSEGDLVLLWHLAIGMLPVCGHDFERAFRAAIAGRVAVLNQIDAGGVVAETSEGPVILKKTERGLVLEPVKKG